MIKIGRASLAMLLLKKGELLILTLFLFQVSLSDYFNNNIFFTSEYVFPTL